MQYEKGAAAVVIVIIVITALLALIGGLVLLTSTGYRSYHFSKNRAQALYLAEAGISSAIREIKDNEDHDEDGGVGSISEIPLTYSDGSLAGSYSVECVLDSSYILTSTGIVNKGSENEVERKISAEYSVPGGGEGIEEFRHIASYKTSCSQRLIDLGAYETPNMPIPDMNFFRDNADYIRESGFTSDAEDELTRVYYIQGDAKLRKGTTLKGTIVVDGGKLTVEKECEIDPSESPDSYKRDFPAIVVYGGTGEVTTKKGIEENETEIHGLVYASDSVQTNKYCSIEGVIIADEIEVDKDNKIEYEEVSPPGFSGGTPLGGRTVTLVPGSWQELSQ